MMIVDVMPWPPIKNLYVFFMKNTIIGFWIMIEKKLTFCLLDGVSDPALEKGKDIWFEVDRKARRRRGRGRRVFT
ncbi:hypothetical protein BCV52_20090 [Priestia aryabhattai]|nr:hypothetical protein BCV52_20090 [Priestia aryabhattai]